MNAMPHPRHHLAALIRRFYVGRITNWELEDQAELFLCDNAAAREVFWHGPWTSYDDFPENRFTDRSKLTREDRRTIARWILFLKSGQSYEWPLEEKKQNAPMSLGAVSPPSTRFAWLTRCFESILPGSLLALTINYCRRHFDHTKYPPSTGDVWPFRLEADFSEARRHPPFLIGKKPSP